ncbi:MAG: sensor histidine kinase [Lachnospiraceae bacterium]|nr:sensor histidine kinase [Lachnospiraceae bacterium]
MVYTEKKNVVLSVHNRGSVISEDDMPYIFGRFYRGDKTRNIQKGHGLGLPIIKQITQLLEANIEVQSNKQNGTVFTVKFRIIK